MEPTIALGEPDGSDLSANARALADALRAAGVGMEEVVGSNPTRSTSDSHK
jgi:hypothetical protein